MNRGRLIIISGPSGVGKSTVIAELLKTDPGIHFSVSATTREPRAGEIDGVNYYFVTRERFEQMIKNGELLEYAEYVGKYYGTPAAPIDEQLKNGRDVLLDIEVQGALQVMEKRPDALTIFITPPDIATLESRLRGRGTNDEDTIRRRVARALEELELKNAYRHHVVNDVVDKTVREILDIIASN